MSTSIPLRLGPPFTRVPPAYRTLGIGSFSLPLPIYGIRGAANSATNRPGSQTIEHARINIREEAQATASSVAKIIAGPNTVLDVAKTAEDSFLGITLAVASSVPKPVLYFGLAGCVPYLATSATVVYLAHEAGLSAMGISIGMDPGVVLTILDQALTYQITYGAIMLSFLGAMHWGLEIAGYDGQKGVPRLVLGIAPAVYGWSTLAIDPTIALLAQFLGFMGLWWADANATIAGWVPQWYSQYRFYLTLLAGTCIFGTLSGISYWGPVAGHGFETHALDEHRTRRRLIHQEGVGITKTDIEAVPDESADAFVVIRHNPECKIHQKE